MSAQALGHARLPLGHLAQGTRLHLAQIGGLEVLQELGGLVEGAGVGRVHEAGGGRFSIARLRACCMHMSLRLGLKLSCVKKAFLYLFHAQRGRETAQWEGSARTGKQLSSSCNAL